MARSATADGPGEFLPLTPVAFEILLALAAGDRHGYAILRDIEERASGRIGLHPGTLYRAINRLMESGLLVELDERPAPELDDQRRRYYRLTELGRQVAVAEARRLEGQLFVARARRLLRRPNTA